MKQNQILLGKRKHETEKPSFLPKLKNNILEVGHLEIFSTSNLGAVRKWGKPKLKPQETDMNRDGTVIPPTTHTLLQLWLSGMELTRRQVNLVYKVMVKLIFFKAVRCDDFIDKFQKRRIARDIGGKFPSITPSY